ncbi:hypothetical protein TSTA_061970 [Talaromyces stipitatus ATCC 10500]|uniref:Myb-like domain-containing protein n=1 Tax=Talaromyces stipitatus (strain ATCC 10500 / CBS 375.48 / QM 6759 / NRRL 1006) TaxID=441959 RepID=B8LX59_TALSN|nr:uncharacterized protein TSTA_061970 [Talaromyces stipitatus ATCC 10500]EED22709.1 hypothetical protein TSTA_061970 [Talaromyces stipitatus ATCC 10500]
MSQGYFGRQDSGVSGFISPDEFSQESDSIRDHFASTPNPQPEQQSTSPGAAPLYDPLDQQTHLSHAHTAELETGTASTLQPTCGDGSQDLSSNKRRTVPEYSSGQPSKRVCARTTTNENVNTPLIPTLCSYFLTAPVDDRLEFLSWLFDGALSQCMSGFPTTPTSSLNKARIKGTGRRGRQTRQLVPTASESVPSSAKGRKGMSWEPEEIDLLVQLRRVEKLPWSDVVKRLTERFPGRTAGSIQENAEHLPIIMNTFFFYEPNGSANRFSNKERFRPRPNPQAHVPVNRDVIGISESTSDNNCDMMHAANKTLQALPPEPHTPTRDQFYFCEVVDDDAQPRREHAQNATEVIVIEENDDDCR